MYVYQEVHLHALLQCCCDYDLVELGQLGNTVLPAPARWQGCGAYITVCRCCLLLVLVSAVTMLAAP